MLLSQCRRAEPLLTDLTLTPTTMRTYENFLFGGESSTSKLPDLGRAGIRVFAGLTLALAHGLGKLPPSEGFVEDVADMGFPAPGFFAWMAALTEFVGGLLLAAGLLTRPVSLFVVINMAVAGFLSQAGDPYELREKAFLFGFVALMYLLAGAGRYSADALIRRNRS